jgi:succinyl-CoA synthetase alpha subunit
MSILVNSSTKVITQGMTGETGTFHTEQALAYGTKMVGGVTPGKGGQTHIGLPVFDTVQEAVRETGADASVVYVPPPFAADSILEAIDAEVPLIVCITEGIPVLDMVKVKRALVGSKSRLIGPNCPGVLTPNECKIGIMPATSSRRARSASSAAPARSPMRRCSRPTNEGPRPDDRGRHRRRSGQRHQLHRRARAVPCRRRDQVDHHDRRDRRIGRGGGRPVHRGRGEARPLQADGRLHRRPHAPPGRRMGHAGAIVSGGKGGADDKIEAMEAAGIRCRPSPSELGTTLARF